MSWWNEPGGTETWISGIWNGLKNIGDNVDPSGMAGYAVDDVTISNMKNEGVLTPEGSINNDYEIPLSDIRNPNVMDQIAGLEEETPAGGGGGGGGRRKQAIQDAMDLVDATAKYNNEWSAKQAEIQRDWQKMMSDTAHQREIADLKAAGLNPVLSAGGQGASTPSGAMGQTDTSNTRLIGEMAMSAIEGLSGAAVAGSTGAATGGLGAWLDRNKGRIGTVNQILNGAKKIADIIGKIF